ncbi:MAG: FecR domain-containing protein [Planctomycetota bacterium]
MSSQPMDNVDPAEALIDGYLDGTLTGAEHDELFARLETEPALLKRFAKLTELDAICREHAGNQIEAEQVRSQMLPLAEDPFGPVAAANLLNELAMFEESLEDELPLVDITDQVKPHRVDQPRTHFDRRRDEPRMTRTIQLVIPTWAVYAGLAAACVIAALLLWPHTPDAEVPRVADTPAPASPSTTPEPEPAPPPFVPNEIVATLTAVHDAQWAEGAYAPGARLRVGDRLNLTAGFAEITTARGAVSVLEAPAVVELMGDDNGLRLHAGKLVGKVHASRAKGFTVYTPGMRVVDLGTEFGVSADRRAGTQVHVFEGEVLAAPTEAAGHTAQSVIVRATQAARLDSRSGGVVAVNFDPALFQRRIVKRLNLVDLIAGGDGSGDRQGIGLHPMTGSYVSNPSDQSVKMSFTSDGRSHPVPGSSLVARTFVPSKNQGVLGLPDGLNLGGVAPSSGVGYGLIWCGGPVSSTNPSWVAEIPLTLSGRPLSEAGDTVIMHANAGLVLDLDAIGKRYPGFRVTGLEARIANTAGRVEAGDEKDYEAVFQVFVDSQIAFQADFKRSLPIDQHIQDIDLPLKAGGRYLTLISTDGGDSVFRDWIVLADPVLELTAN